MYTCCLHIYKCGKLKQQVMRIEEVYIWLMVMVWVDTETTIYYVYINRHFMYTYMSFWFICMYTYVCIRMYVLTKRRYVGRFSIRGEDISIRLYVM